MRPPFLRVTAVATPHGKVHLSRGWNAYFGFKTACERYVSQQVEEVYLHSFDAEDIREAFGQQDICLRCMIVWRDRQR